MAGRGVALRPAAFRRSFARDLRFRARYGGARRHRSIPASPAQERRRGAEVRRRTSPPHSRGEILLRRLCGSRPARRRGRLRLWRHAVAAGGGQGLLRLFPCRQRRQFRLPAAHGGQREPAAGARFPGADRSLRAADARRPLYRHHVPVRAPGRLVAERHRHAGGAGRRISAGAALPDFGQQDVDLVRRARDRGEHRSPRAREDPGWAAGSEGDLAVHRAAPASSRRMARSASATT